MNLPTNNPNSASNLSDSDNEDLYAKVFPPIKKKRREYGTEDRKVMMKYLLANNRMDYVTSRTMWVEMEQKKILPGRSWQSLKEHFVKKLLPFHLHELSLSDSELEFIFNKVPSAKVSYDAIVNKKKNILLNRRLEHEEFFKKISPNQTFNFGVKNLINKRDHSETPRNASDKVNAIEEFLTSENDEMDTDDDLVDEGTPVNNGETPVNNEETQVNNQETAGNDEENQVNNQETQVNNQETQVNNQETQVNNKENKVNNQENKVNNQETQVNNQETQVNNQETQVNNQETQVNNQETQVNNKENKVNNQENKVNNQEIPVINLDIPVINEETPVINEEAPVINEVTPVINEETPVINEVTPVINEVTPVINEEAPVINEVTSVNHEETPVNDEESAINNEQLPINNEETPVNNEDTPVNYISDSSNESFCTAVLESPSSSPLREPSQNYLMKTEYQKYPKRSEIPSMTCIAIKCEDEISILDPPSQQYEDVNRNISDSSQESSSSEPSILKKAIVLLERLPANYFASHSPLTRVTSSKTTQTKNSDSRPNNSLENNRSRRIPFSLEEDLCVVQYIINNNRQQHIGGNVLWQDMEEEKMELLKNRSWQSLKERYRKRILPRISEYPLNEQEVQKLGGTVARNRTPHQVPPTRQPPPTSSDDVTHEEPVPEQPSQPIPVSSSEEEFAPRRYWKVPLLVKPKKKWLNNNK